VPVRTTIDLAGDLVRNARRIVVCTGAGVSTDSGIPDYRGPAGQWTRDPAAARFADLSTYLADAALREQAWARRVTNPVLRAEPNAAHVALAQLYGHGVVSAVLTQNVDGLHQKAGVPDHAVLELHGNVRDTRCVDCGERRPMAEALERVRGGERDPKCLDCGGILKSATVLFGEAVDATVFAEAARLLATADLLWVIGSSLRVQPVAGMVAATARETALIIVNAEPTPYDDLAAAVVRDPIGVAVPAIVEEARR
jgi:NAD-dependent protein deacetylase/lipoamidase